MDEFVDTSDFPDPVISHCDPQHPTVVSSTTRCPVGIGQWRPSPTGMTWRPNFLLTWQPGTSISATVPWLRVEDWNMLKICSPVIIYYRVINYGYSWMWMEDDEPHDCSFQNLSLRQGVTWNRYIWGKDGPCSTWPSLDSLQTGTVQPFRGWIQVFSPNHPPKKVLAAGYQW